MRFSCFIIQVEPCRGKNGLCHFCLQYGLSDVAQYVRHHLSDTWRVTFRQRYDFFQFQQAIPVEILALEGQVIRDNISIMMMDNLENFIQENNIEIVALTIPKEAARQIGKRVADAGIKAIWNFAHTDLNLPDDVIVENVHLSESLMRLSYTIANKD